ncbi:Rv3235 family protein [Mycobacterium rhizamassiliense]|uniref:Rv3235 family protein n=1 Tax=Mycobacterium rhizamassiliense TaxID=1841860 RepID=UPI00097CEABE|nr:Rv3235 family protein [Mycobacterium rhizamassiliense]
MTVSPATSPPDRAAFAVEPVVEYEPPQRDVPREVPRAAPLCRTPRRPYSSRRVSHPPPPASPTPSAPMRQAAVFADAALRRVLEVIDRRRPPAQLRPLLVAGLIDPMLAVSRAAAGQQGAAMLRRVRLQPVGPPDHETAAEVFGCYSRADRMHAIACRVEKLPTGGGTRWQVVALHIG